MVATPLAAATTPCPPCASAAAQDDGSLASGGGFQPFQLSCKKCDQPTTSSQSIPQGANELLRSCLDCVSYDKALQRRSNPKPKTIHGEKILTETQKQERKDALNAKLCLPPSLGNSGRSGLSIWNLFGISLEEILKLFWGVYLFGQHLGSI